MQTFRNSWTQWTTWTTTRLRALTPNALQIAGIATFDLGCFVLADWLGFMVAGAALAFIGWVVDK